MRRADLLVAELGLGVLPVGVEKYWGVRGSSSVPGRGSPSRASGHTPPSETGSTVGRARYPGCARPTSRAVCYETSRASPRVELVSSCRASALLTATPHTSPSRCRRRLGEGAYVISSVGPRQGCPFSNIAFCAGSHAGLSNQPTAPAAIATDNLVRDGSLLLFIVNDVKLLV